MTSVDQNPPVWMYVYDVWLELSTDRCEIAPPTSFSLYRYMQRLAMYEAEEGWTDYQPITSFSEKQYVEEIETWTAQQSGRLVCMRWISHEPQPKPSLWSIWNALEDTLAPYPFGTGVTKHDVLEAIRKGPALSWHSPFTIYSYEANHCLEQQHPFQIEESEIRWLTHIDALITYDGIVAALPHYFTFRDIVSKRGNFEDGLMMENIEEAWKTTWRMEASGSDEAAHRIYAHRLQECQKRHEDGVTKWLSEYGIESRQRMKERQ